MDGHLPFLFEIPSNGFPTLLRSRAEDLIPLRHSLFPYDDHEGMLPGQEASGVLLAPMHRFRWSCEWQEEGAGRGSPLGLVPEEVSESLQLSGEVMKPTFCSHSSCGFWAPTRPPLPFTLLIWLFWSICFYRSHCPVQTTLLKSK